MPQKVTIEDDIFLDCYRHLINSEEFFDIDFLYGGRDSGKSRHVAMQLIVSCLQQPYFKCLLIRKELNTVRGSQYDLIKSVIEEWGLTRHFRFNETRLEIIYNKNGNGFYGRGLDDVGKIKSFNNPSCCWIEEGNQIDKDDFVVILTSLRANQDVKTWFTFNPECEMNYTEFWLYDEWFSHTTALSWSWTKTITVDDEPIQYKARATHSTYRDNPYCKPQRKALYESYKNSKNNAYWYQTYTLGLWGYRRTGGEFWKCFDEQKHTKKVEYDNTRVVYVIADSNVNPYCAASFWQVNAQQKKLRQIYELPCEHPENNAVKAAKKCAKWLKSIDYKLPVHVGGDPSANAKNTIDEEGKSFFDKFKAALKEEGFDVVDKVGKSAPGVAASGSFINEIYESNYLGWSIEIDVNCRKSIEDYTMVKEDIDGTMLKKKETNPDTKVSFERYGHFSDDKRYFITTILAGEFNQYKSRTKKGGAVDMPD